MTYSDELLKKKFIGNVVIQIKGQYFCTRIPDSGLAIGANYQGTVKGLSIDPTQVDLKLVSTTIASYGFVLQDKAKVVTSLFSNNTYLLTGETVNIWIGRITGSFDFSQYFKLPVTKVKQVTYNGDGTYNFSVAEQTDRMNKSIFGLQTTLSGTIISGTTTISVQSNTDLSKWPSSGIWKIDDEFGTYAGIDNALKQLTGCTRGLKGTIPSNHNAGATVYNVVDIQGNPLNILLWLLISKGGGGAYDVLIDGVGLSQSLVDVAGIETLRDTYFVTQQFLFSMYAGFNALTFLENEILQPCNLRLATSPDSKVSVVILNKSPFNPSPALIDEHTITQSPTWTVDENQIINQISVEWDWDEGAQTFKQITPYADAESIAQYGEKPVFKIQSHGIKSSLSGQAIVDSFANNILNRFKQPMPEVDLSVQMDKSLLNVGSKATVKTTKLPSGSGDFNFSAELEVFSRAINYQTGDVKLKMMFTSYSNLRQAFIAPCDLIASVIDQKTFRVPVGKGSSYFAGWVMRLWDVVNGQYFSDPPNTIQSIVGDQITMTSPFSTILLASIMALKFPYYDEASTVQKASYGFIDIPGSDFLDGSKPYVITF